MKNQTSLQHDVSFAGTELTEVRNKMLRAGVAVAILVCASAQAVTITQINRSDMPVLGDPDMPVTTLITTDDASTDVNGAQLAQTFQVASAFDLTAIYWQFRDETGLDTTATLDLAIYEVADVFAASLSLGLEVWSAPSVTAPGFPSTDSKTAYLDLEGASVTLAATSGSAGYAFVMSNAGNTADYAWRRTGATAGNSYAFGTAYSNGSEITPSTPRDFSLGLQAVPEPSTAALAGMGLLLLAGRLRANRDA